MIENFLGATWGVIAPAAGNHLWQSTLFAAAAGVLTFFLRNHRARARYWLWLGASAKFLLPFSLLITLGSHLALPPSPGTTNALYVAAVEFGQPFTAPTIASHPEVAASPTHFYWLAAPLVGVWLLGFATVLVIWSLRWRRVKAVLRRSVPLSEGREAEALQLLERVAGMSGRLPLLLSPDPLEPGIFGIIRPVLLWPQDISQHLENTHLKAILAHELCHVRRRDNLTAAVHMLVEAIFWFHPLVWWLGTRLLEERERACDEEVLEPGSDRRVYAESILKVCEFCMGSPLACVSGVTGADLKKRIVHIMSEQAARKLDLSRKLMLGAAAFVAVALPILFGLATATPSRAQAQADVIGNLAATYQVTSIRPNNSPNHLFRLMFTPNELSATGITVNALIQEAYGIEGNRITGAPAWIDSKYDIEATVDSGAAAQIGKLGEEQRSLVTKHMLQELLAHSFKLRVHADTKELPTYSLLVAENGPKLQQAKPGDAAASGLKGPDGRPAGPHTVLMSLDRGRISSVTAKEMSMADLARLLSRELGSTVVDKTGLAGSYDVALHWTPDSNQLGGAGNSPQGSGSSISAALEEQLGLKVESQIGPATILVIDHVEEPSEN